MRRRAKVDANQPLIVRELRAMGMSVAITSGLGEGFPDLVVGCMNRNFLFEVKDEQKPPSQKRLTEDEAAWHRAWSGQVHVIENTADALKILRAICEK